MITITSIYLSAYKNFTFQLENDCRTVETSLFSNIIRFKKLVDTPIFVLKIRIKKKKSVYDDISRWSLNKILLLSLDDLPYHDIRRHVRHGKLHLSL